MDTTNNNMFDLSNRIGKFLDEYQTNQIICSNVSDPKYKDGVDWYYSLNNYLADEDNNGNLDPLQ